MILDASDFANIPFKIPNQTESSAWLDAFIDDQEAKYLKKLLGLELYREFTEALEESGELDQKWIDLRDGADYTYGGKLNEYTGVIKLLQPVIYAEWLPVNERRQTSSGTILNKGQQNTEAVSSWPDQVKYWNEFVVLSGHKLSQWNSLYGFLKANEDVYYSEIDFCFKEQLVKNQHDF